MLKKERFLKKVEGLQLRTQHHQNAPEMVVNVGDHTPHRARLHSRTASQLHSLTASQLHSLTASQLHITLQYSANRAKLLLKKERFLKKVRS